MAEYVIPHVIGELIEKGIPVTVEADGLGLYFRLSGFYKSNTVLLRPSRPFFSHEGELTTLMAESRYGALEQIDSVADVVALNYYWWNTSKDRSDFWSQPDPMWLPLLIEHGYFEEAYERTFREVKRGVRG